MIANLTPYPHDTAILYDRKGLDVVVLAVKATFRLSTGGAEKHPVSLPVYGTDQRFPSGALRYPNDLALEHRGTDIVCIGTAYAPRDKPLPSFDASLRAGELTHTVRVFGRRVWQRDRGTLRPSAPAPFAALPLGFEQAFGGPGLPENPIGRGYAVAAPGAELPGFEDPAFLIGSIESRPPPAGFGAIAPEWQPRAGFAGVYDSEWARTRAPLLPKSFDDRFFNVAARGLTASTPLVGGEPLSLRNLTREGVLDTRVPRVHLRVRVERTWRRPQLDLLVLEPDEDRISLTFRLTIDVAGRLDNLPRIHILERELVPLGERGARA